MFVLLWFHYKKKKKKRFSFIIKNHLDQNDLNEFLQCLRPRCRRGPSEFDTSWFRSWLPDGAPPSATPEPIKNHSTSQSRSFPGSLSSSILTSFHFHTALPRCLALIVLFFFTQSSKSNSVLTLLWLRLVLQVYIWRARFTPLTMSEACRTWGPPDPDSQKKKTTTKKMLLFSAFDVFFGCFCCFFSLQRFRPPFSVSLRVFCLFCEGGLMKDFDILVFYLDFSALLSTNL